MSVAYGWAGPSGQPIAYTPVPDVPAPRRRAWWASLLLSLAVALAVVAVTRTVAFQISYIPSASMEPTLHGCPGCTPDRVLVDRVAVRTGVHRGDVIVFRDTQNWLPPYAGTVFWGRAALAEMNLAANPRQQCLAKRVIGVGGDIVVARHGKLSVNAVPLTEPYLYPGDAGSDTDFTVHVPAGKLWVMGDHRSDSADSRYHTGEPGHGFVDVQDVVGRVDAITFPLSRARLLHRPDTFDLVPDRI